jgi:UDP-N-acetylglucosamine 1-carboxyvinyltransferase
MNVLLDDQDGHIYCTTKGMIGTDIILPFPSVGATENVILAAVLATGVTRIFNAAREPEITELCKFLNVSGAKISGVGTDTIAIEGVNALQEAEYTAASDRIVAGTYLAAVAGSGGEVVLKGINAECLQCVIDVLSETGCKIISQKDYIHITVSERPKPIPLIRTMPYPGFPTDMQSQMMSVLMKATGTSIIIEEIFEGRYQNVQEQIKFGADIQVNGREAVIHGRPSLSGCEVYASELRGGAALVIAGLMAEGKTTIYNPHFIERGYENICRDLRALGADINYKN